MTTKNKQPLQTRSFSFEIRAEQEEKKGNVITGRPIVYDSKTDLGFCFEMIEKGALDDCDLTDVRFLVNHDTNRIPLARSRKNNENSTMQLKVDDQGLFIKVYLDCENNTEARNLYSAIERGDITGMSFMFAIDEEEALDIDSDKPTYIIKKISSVVEVSAVTFPAYNDTEINARSKSDLDKLRLKLENDKQIRAKALENATQRKVLNSKAKAILKIYGGK